MIRIYLPFYPDTQYPTNRACTPTDQGEGWQFLMDLSWQLSLMGTEGDPGAVIKRLAADPSLMALHHTFKAIMGEARRRFALHSYEPLKAHQLSDAYQAENIATHSGLQAYIMDLLSTLQADINCGEGNRLRNFYDGGKPLAENDARDKVYQSLDDRTHHVSKLFWGKEQEHAQEKRSDIEVNYTASSPKIRIPIEAKLTKNRELFSAIENQLAPLYADHDEAQGHGIYLVFWYGDAVSVRGGKSKSPTPSALLMNLSQDLPQNIRVFVLDVSVEDHPS